MANAPKKDKKTNLKPTDKDNPKKIRWLECLQKLFMTRYMFNQVLSVTLHDQILWEADGVVLGVTNVVGSVTKICGFAK